MTEMVQLSELTGGNGNGALRYPTAADIQQMSAVEIMHFAMCKAAVGGNWQLAAHIAWRLAPYQHAQMAPVVATDDDEQNCLHN
jgi:hypothetical protein